MDLDLGDPDAPYRPPVVPPGRRAWLVLRVYAAMLLGFGLNFYGFLHHRFFECFLGCVLLIGGMLLSYSKGSGFRHRSDLES